MSKFIVIAKYTNGQIIEKEIPAENPLLAIEKMKELCPRADEWKIKELP